MVNFFLKSPNAQDFTPEEQDLLAEFKKIREDYYFLLNIRSHYFKFCGEIHKQFDVLCLRAALSRLALLFFEKPMLDYRSDKELVAEITSFHLALKNSSSNHTGNLIVNGTWEEKLRDSSRYEFKRFYRYNKAFLATSIAIVLAAPGFAALFYFGVVGSVVAAVLFGTALAIGLIGDLVRFGGYSKSSKSKADKQDLSNRIDGAIKNIKDYCTNIMNEGKEEESSKPNVDTTTHFG